MSMSANAKELYGSADSAERRRIRGRRRFDRANHKRLCRPGGLPAWVEIINDNATVSLLELKQWLGIKDWHGLRQCHKRGLPRPLVRVGSAWSVVITAYSRWRAGDIRAWLRGEPVHPVPMPSNKTMSEIAREQSRACYRHRTKGKP